MDTNTAIAVVIFISVLLIGSAYFAFRR